MAKILVENICDRSLTGSFDGGIDGNRLMFLIVTIPSCKDLLIERLSKSMQHVSENN